MHLLQGLGKTVLTVLGLGVHVEQHSQNGLLIKGLANSFCTGGVVEMETDLTLSPSARHSVDKEGVVEEEL